MAGWICLHRKMLEWEWYDDHNVTRLFIHCIFRANYEPKKWQGVDISRGEFITSFDKLSREVGLTVKQTRLSINKLKKTNELSTRSTSRHTVVTVISYDSYQRKDGEGASEGRTTGQAKDKQKTSKGQAEGEQRATDNNITNKQINNITNKQDNNTSSPAATGKLKSAPAKFIPPVLAEVDLYKSERNSNIDSQKFINHYAAVGWMRGKAKIKDWKACYRTWEQNQKTNFGQIARTTNQNGMTANMTIDQQLNDRSWADDGEAGQEFSVGAPVIEHPQIKNIN